MSNMENLDKELSERERQARVYERSIASIREKDLKKEASGYGVMSTVLGYGEASEGDGAFGKISHVAKLFCIAFAGLAPCLLVAQALIQ